MQEGDGINCGNPEDSRGAYAPADSSLANEGRDSTKICELAWGAYVKPMGILIEGL